MSGSAILAAVTAWQTACGSNEACAAVLLTGSQQQESVQAGEYIYGLFDEPRIVAALQANCLWRWIGVQLGQHMYRLQSSVKDGHGVDEDDSGRLKDLQGCMTVHVTASYAMTLQAHSAQACFSSLHKYSSTT